MLVLIDEPDLLNLKDLVIFFPKIKMVNKELNVKFFQLLIHHSLPNACPALASG